MLAIGLALAFGLGTGCHMFRREMPRPGRTTLDSPLVMIPARTMANYLIVQGKWDKRGPYNFLIDTGASVTLVAPELAARYSAKNTAPAPTPLVRVKSADGETALLSAATLRRIELGDARFENVQVLIYDCAAISAHLGVKIDGVLGFPLFRETLLTLDYPHSRVLLQKRSANPLLPGSVIPFNNDRKTPIIPLRLGDQTFVALIDSGSDATLSLNPAGLAPTFTVPPRVGATVATLSGDREQHIGRLAQALRIGDYLIDQPVVDLTDELTSLGGGLLKHFTVTFDQEHSRVTFYRESTAPVPSRSSRSTGLSFSKAPAYWRVVSVIPQSPAEAEEIQPGDLVTRINGQPVAEWDISRYQELVASADEVTFTFLNGTRETEKRLKVFDLVP
ncbi:PDZ/DHR/GLGF domain protein [Opitutus terrae PB90-1]|uniref:PDZ/DHR/GLGF domain protein n=2 Tax=Opitutus terrae TaxID=107709 RepID=B1ZZX1_OPITP|nr:PDZ/DHR/GLGF domain protein [Opitutus terrae PB90-1]